MPDTINNDMDDELEVMTDEQDECLADFGYGLKLYADTRQFIICGVPGGNRYFTSMPALFAFLFRQQLRIRQAKDLDQWRRIHAEAVGRLAEIVAAAEKAGVFIMQAQRQEQDRLLAEKHKREAPDKPRTGSTTVGQERPATPAKTSGRARTPPPDIQRQGGALPRAGAGGGI